MDQQGVRRARALTSVGVNPWTVESLVVTSIDYMKRAEILPSVLEANWDLVIVDEAHGACGQSDRRDAGVERVPERAVRPPAVGDAAQRRRSRLLHPVRPGSARRRTRRVQALACRGRARQRTTGSHGARVQHPCRTPHACCTRRAHARDRTRVGRHGSQRLAHAVAPAQARPVESLRPGDISRATPAVAHRWWKPGTRATVTPAG